MGKSTYLHQGKAVASCLQEVLSPVFLEVLDVLEFASWSDEILQLLVIT